MIFIGILQQKKQKKNKSYSSFVAVSFRCDDSYTGNPNDEKFKSLSYPNSFLFIFIFFAMSSTEMRSSTF